MLIHVGYRKCASTFLQRNVFWDSVGPFGRIDAKHPALQGILPQEHDVFDLDEARLVVSEKRAEIASAGKLPVLSRESLAGRPAYSGHQHDIRAQRLETCRRLAAVAPDARILIVIREQLSAQMSSYRQYVRRGGKLSLRDFFSSDRRQDGYDLRIQFLYHELIETYQHSFGKAKVLVLPFELLPRDPDEFVHRIERFCDLKPWRNDWSERPEVNEGLQPSQLLLKRMFNSVIDLGRNPYRHGDVSRAPRSVHFRVSSVLKKIIGRNMGGIDDRLRSRAVRRLETINGNYFAECNRKTEKLTGLSLDQYGYRL